MYNAVLFFLCVPGIVVRLPPMGDKVTVALVHTILFAGLHALGARYVKQIEGFFAPDTRVVPACPDGSTRVGLECRLP